MPYEQWLKDIEYNLRENRREYERTMERVGELSRERIRLLDAREDLKKIIERRSD